MSDVIYSNVQSKAGGDCCIFSAGSSPCSPYPSGDCPPETQAQEPAYNQCVAESSAPVSDAASCTPVNCGFRTWICG